MLTAKDFVPSLAQDNAPESEREAIPTPAPLVPGSATAKALLAAWRGDPVVVVDSPPGGGKTESTVTIAAHLAVRAGLVVCAAFPRRMQALAFTHRVIKQVPPSQVVLQMSGLSRADIPEGVQVTPPAKGGYVMVRTVSSLASSFAGRLAASNDVLKDHVLIVDEAYQVTLAELTSAADGFPQVVVLGDPGQIGPVVTHDVSLWSDRNCRPQTPSPTVLRQRETAAIFHIDSTWRLGPETVSTLAPCYDFPFQSRRPARSASIGGRGLGEIERLAVPSGDDRLAAKLVADRAAALVGSELYEGDKVRAATERDVVVIVSRNAEAAAVSAHLADAGMSEIEVGTADRLQGYECAMVVALDPCYGALPGDSHAIDTGRTCVMMSRHTTHLTWAYDNNWANVLGDDEDNPGVQVRRRVMAAPLAG